MHDESIIAKTRNTVFLGNLDCSSEQSQRMLGLDLSMSPPQGRIVDKTMLEALRVP